MEESVQRKKNDQGEHECEVLGYGANEAQESGRAWEDCTKNPGHPNFIPAAAFSFRHLPPDFRKPSILNHVRAIAKLTVKLKVGIASPGRPAGYTFSKCRGMPIPHYGTGFVSECYLDEEEECSLGFITILTARHVVFDQKEACATQVIFFYDHEKSLSDGTVKALLGARFQEPTTEDDFCVLKCVTHDLDFVEQLRKAFFPVSIDQAPSRQLKSNQNELSLVVIVSHPHGQPKKVTVGEKIYRKQSKDNGCHFVYNTETCCGSSGALVIVIDSEHNISSISGSAQVDVHSSRGPFGRLNRAESVEFSFAWRQSSITLFWHQLSASDNMSKSPNSLAEMPKLCGLEELLKKCCLKKIPKLYSFKEIVDIRYLVSSFSCKF